MTKTKLLALFAIIGAITSVSAYSAYAVGGFTETTESMGQIVSHGQWFIANDVVASSLTQTSTNNKISAYPIEIANDTQVSAIGMAYHPTQAAAVCRAGIYSDNGTGYPGSLVVDSGNFTKAVNFQENSVSATLSSNTIYWLAMNCNGGTSMKYVTPLPGTFGYDFQVGSDPAAQFGGIVISQTFGDGSNALPSTFPSGTVTHTTTMPFIALQRQ